jgi:hypothetical protein
VAALTLPLGRKSIHAGTKPVVNRLTAGAFCGVPAGRAPVGISRPLSLPGVSMGAGQDHICFPAGAQRTADEGTGPFGMERCAETPDPRVIISALAFIQAALYSLSCYPRMSFIAMWQDEAGRCIRTTLGATPT